MSKILELYSTLKLHRITSPIALQRRFIGEIFIDEVYKESCPKLTIVDLGAFLGEFGYYCYNFAKEIYAIEPAKNAFDVMAKYVREYDLNKMKIFNIAISAQSGSRRINDIDGGNTALLPPGRNDGYPVETLSLNEFFEQNKIEHVDILKIDVESSEYEIFDAKDIDGALSKIDCIVGEAHGGVQGFREALERNGFKEEIYPNCFLFRK